MASMAFAAMCQLASDFVSGQLGHGRGEAHEGKDKHGRGDSLPGDADPITIELAPLAPDVGKP